MFLPSTQSELITLGWTHLDVILVNGDAYIDSPFSGIAIIGKALLDAGYKVGIISQPDIQSDQDILRLGSPRLYWGVSAGATDSMVANYTASGKKRKSCDFTPNGLNIRRPDRACIIYSNLIKRFDTEKKPIVLGGIEASLRRMAHYDMMTDKIRRPILFDAKADWLIYGMGEFSAIELAKCIDQSVSPNNIKGLCYLSKQTNEDMVELPAYEKVSTDKDEFFTFFDNFYTHASTLSDKTLAQKCGDRYLVQNPPYIPSTEELDHIYELDFERDVHPYDLQGGEIKAIHTIQHAITTHRGCFGECNFCAISVHQGRAVISRSKKSILAEALTISKHKSFKGIISDVGGATANMYGIKCPQMAKNNPCVNKRCLYPSVCPSLKDSQKSYVELLQELRKIKDIRKIHIASGIRTDLAMADTVNGGKFIDDLSKYHTSGQIKLAPEHADPQVLQAMGKCGTESFDAFTKRFMRANSAAGKNQFITCYFMAAHPDCTAKSMLALKDFNQKLGFRPEQIQIFTPTPSTWSTCMYHTEKHFATRAKIYVAKQIKDKVQQKEAILPSSKIYDNRKNAR